MGGDCGISRLGGRDSIEPHVVKSVEIAAAAHEVWRALTETDQIAKWMGGAHVESKWEPGAEITFTGKLHA